MSFIRRDHGSGIKFQPPGTDNLTGWNYQLWCHTPDHSGDVFRAIEALTEEEAEQCLRFVHTIVIDYLAGTAEGTEFNDVYLIVEEDDEIVVEDDEAVTP